MKRSRRIALPALLILFLAIGVGARAQLAVPEGLTHEFVVEPGERIESMLTVVSTADEAIEVSLELRDYLFFADGSNVYDDPGTVERSNALWIELYARDPLVLAPGEELQIGFAITVPEDGDLCGTYWCILLVGPVPEENEAEEGLAITTVLKYGIQIVTHIGDSGARSVQAIGAALAQTPDGVQLEVDIENDGEQWVRPTVWADLYDDAGQKVATVESGQLRIYPGTSVRHQFLFGALAPGTYKAVVIIDDRGLEAWAAQYTLNIEEDAD